MKYLLKFIFLFALIPFGNASAVTLDFFCVTGNSASNCAMGEDKFSVDVLANATMGTNFTFNNAFRIGSENPAIAEIYFDSSLLAGIESSDDTSTSDVLLVTSLRDVKFTLDTLSPGNLPGYKPIGFNTAFGADSLPGKANTIGEAEFLTITVKTLSFLQFTKALADDFRIGIHARAFADGGSESFTTSVVPVPAAIWLFGTALIGFVGMSRKRKV